TKSVSVGAVGIGMGQQDLSQDTSAGRDAAHGPNLIARLAVFDDGLALDAGPGVMIERTDHCPRVIGRMIEHHAVIGLCHCSDLASHLPPRCMWQRGARPALRLLRPNSRPLSTFVARPPWRPLSGGGKFLKRKRRSGH